MLFESPHEDIPSAEDKQPERRSMRKFVPKYLQQQQRRGFYAKNQSDHRKRRIRFKCAEDIQDNIDDDDDDDYNDNAEGDGEGGDDDDDDGYDDNVEDTGRINSSPTKQIYANDAWNQSNKKPLSESHIRDEIKNILTYRNTAESCLFYLRFGSSRLIGPFIFHPQSNPEQNQFTDIFLHTGKINAFNPKDLLYMRNGREIPVSKVQIADQILDAAYDLERYILEQTSKSQYSSKRPFVDHNLTQIINDLIGNTHFTITATPVVQNELFIKYSGEHYRKQINHLHRVLDRLREQISQLKDENISLRSELEEYRNYRSSENQYSERQDDKMDDSTFAWHAKLNALLDQYRAENEALKSHNYTLTQSQQTLFRDQEYMQQQNNLLKQEVDELKRSQNLILARSQSAMREERERMNREQEELHRELASVKKKLAQSPVPCPMHHNYQRSHLIDPYSENYHRVPECPKYYTSNEKDVNPPNAEPSRVKRVRICSSTQPSRLPRLNIAGQTSNISISKNKKPETQASNIPRGTAYAKQHTNKPTINKSK
ncbi:unnamed protein product [Trichobilharzia szidati]|nr:unnamed protein product [Trichobilharzia szidati]